MGFQEERRKREEEARREEVGACVHELVWVLFPFLPRLRHRFFSGMITLIRTNSQPLLKAEHIGVSWAPWQPHCTPAQDSRHSPGEGTKLFAEF